MNASFNNVVIKAASGKDTSGLPRPVLVDVTHERDLLQNSMSSQFNKSTSTPTSVRVNNPYKFECMGDPDAVPEQQHSTYWCSRSYSPMNVSSPMVVPDYSNVSPVNQFQSIPLTFHHNTVMQQSTGSFVLAVPPPKMKVSYQNGRPVPVSCVQSPVQPSTPTGSNWYYQQQPSEESVYDPEVDTPISSESDTTPRSPCVVFVQSRRTVEIDGLSMASQALTPYRSHQRFPLGSLVVLDGDRGMHIGIVADVIAESEYDASSLKQKKLQRLQSIRRLATEEECIRFDTEVPVLEARALDFARTTAQSLGLPMRVVGAELQFDGAKLTLHYDVLAPGADKEPIYVPFHDLLKSLHSKFKCRIWLNDLSPARHSTHRC